MSIGSQEQVALLTDYDADSAYSTAYHTLYANICLNWDNAQTSQHSVLLATPMAHSGQVTAVANVAIAAAQSGTPTILVDADMHTPTLEQRFGLGKTAGLSDLLLADTVDTPLLKESLRGTFVPSLRLLTAGTATGGTAPALAVKFQEVLQALNLFLQETESKPNLLLFHSPPVLVGPEASLIGSHVEQTILTIAKGRTTRKQAKEAQEQLQRTHGHLVGIVLLKM